MESAGDKKPRKSIELATFYVGKALCGMDILQIKEINKLMDRTTVPQAPDYVLGILNLRGQIVTIIDLAKKLGLSTSEELVDPRNIIVNSYDGSAGILVSKIGDVFEMPADQMEKPPANMHGIKDAYFAGAFKTETLLIGVLDIDKVLSIDE